MQDNETVTITIKKSDIEYLKKYIQSSDSTNQALCSTILNIAGEDVYRNNPFELINLKLLVGRMSLLATQTKIDALKILTGAQNG